MWISLVVIGIVVWNKERFMFRIFVGIGRCKELGLNNDLVEINLKMGLL